MIIVLLFIKTSLYTIHTKYVNASYISIKMRILNEIQTNKTKHLFIFVIPLITTENLGQSVQRSSNRRKFFETLTSCLIYLPCMIKYLYFLIVIFLIAESSQDLDDIHTYVLFVSSLVLQMTYLTIKQQLNRTPTKDQDTRQAMQQIEQEQHA